MRNSPPKTWKSLCSLALEGHRAWYARRAAASDVPGPPFLSSAAIALDTGPDAASIRTLKRDESGGRHFSALKSISIADIETTAHACQFINHVDTRLHGLGGELLAPKSGREKAGGIRITLPTPSQGRFRQAILLFTCTPCDLTRTPTLLQQLIICSIARVPVRGCVNHRLSHMHVPCRGVHQSGRPAKRHDALMRQQSDRGRKQQAAITKPR